MNKKSLIDKDLLNKFGTKDSINISELIKKLKILNKVCPDPKKDLPFFSKQKNKFHISKTSQKDIKIFSNFSKYISRCMNWKSPRMQFSVTPPATISSVATSSIASLLNQNGVWDVATGDLIKLEIELSNYFANLVSWKNSLGIFTFGGTATNMYGIKIGIEKSGKDLNKKGVGLNNYVISNLEGHSCHTSVCNWLGIGTDNCIRINNDIRGFVDTKELFVKVENLMKKGKKISCIILNGGTHFDGRIDPIKKICNRIKNLSKKYKLNYKPHIHIDSVTGWIFLLYKFYNFNKNKFNFPKEINKKLESIFKKIKDIKFADSFGIDFHKTGFCPYLSSMFITKNKKDWEKITGDQSIFLHESFNFGEYKPGQFTLETSRPMNGAVSAYTTLNSLGIEGIQKIIANYFYISKDMHKKFKIKGDFMVANENSDNWTTIFLIKLNNEITFNKLYSSNKEIIEKSNRLQKDFYAYLIKKYDNLLPWHIGFAKNYKIAKSKINISGLKSFPMSPFHTTQDNEEFITWITEEFKKFSLK
jgi:glutamate/tyrosine decarboxylase-like PLP-dependent enzyme